ncbi:hypothetical protein TEHN7126_0218 [Tetragenococcus halophilus subsp. halophilus]|uniref:LicD family protein n=1 Tax=Tetragenococcus halophilus TaxID=51669 RepID=UPI000CC7C76D|nr:LicD family protein [Tetragenococcus halophilus]GBD74299.1 hypothetical protein TEHN7125_2459 [Tetragenococcus halophilus subsp. halophilus]GBD74519.1 hypothetical protein TEHN7126_0218 [Tetragenococcus halophilus subsp. halophilus]
MKKRVSLAEQKKIMLEILDYIDKICVKYGIFYSLSGGTLLGAVRHKGFIPWDDDIDVMLTRDNYEKLIYHLEKEPGDYTFLNYPITGYQYVFAKLCSSVTYQKSPNSEINSLGIFVDIFPIDSLPTQSLEREKFVIEVKELQKKAVMADFYSYAGSNTYLKKIVKAFLYFPKFYKLSRQSPMKRRLEALNLKMQEFNGKDTKYVGFVCSRYALTKEKFPKEIFEEYNYYEFEGRKYQGIKDADIYLTQLYGDYMKMPPKDKQVNHDFYKWYWKETVRE